MKKFGTIPRAPWPRWALLWGAPCVAVALGSIGTGLMVGERSATGTALVIVGAVGALFVFVLTMPRRTDSHEPG
ncbi:hypothetical protein [Streptomyces rochei]|uniref:hypothetical protein n=1 Tax=Streptomyces rochei TaxID=1928 RepID=UPI00362B9007